MVIKGDRPKINISTYEAVLQSKPHTAEPSIYMLGGQDEANNYTRFVD